MKIPRRSLRRYEATSVILTLDNNTGVRGFLERVYPDHVVMRDAQGMVPAADGETLMESALGTDVIPRGRIVRLRPVGE
jgi:hypothetical protein